jgi:ABC-type transport system involved in cytochrome bd biosynthesis fused ATPase/permease subunit
MLLVLGMPFIAEGLSRIILKIRVKKDSDRIWHYSKNLIEIRNYSFCYAAKKQPVLKDLNFNVLNVRF